MRTRKMTARYWNSLCRGSKERALSFVFGYQKAWIDVCLSEKPDLKDGVWQMIFRKVRIPEDHTHYKTVVNNTFIT